MQFVDLLIESGKKFTFATAVDWPGWSRRGRGESAALEALLASAPRFAEILVPAGIPFEVPNNISAFRVVERQAGNASTDFGAPGVAPSRDAEPLNEAELERATHLLQAYWQAFDKAAALANTPLQTGPRGGGRTLEKIQEHVLEADRSYLRRITASFKRDKEAPLTAELSRCRQTILKALASAVHDGLPESGPRGGKLWTPRYFVRATAWHVIDHTWEIEDRSS